MARTIFMLDLDAFFCSVEEIYDYRLKNIPFAIANVTENGLISESHSIISTSNYEARKYGVKSAMHVYDAIKLCKNLKLVPANMERYIDASKRFLNLITTTYTNKYEQTSIDDYYLDVTELLPMYHDNPLILAAQIQDLVYKRLKLSVSIGISNVKSLAKIACDFNKPRGITTLYPSEITTKLFNLSIDKINGVGKKRIIQFHNLGIRKVLDFYNYKDHKKLKSIFGAFYNHLMSLINVSIENDDQVIDKYNESKQISRTHTYSLSSSDFDELKIKLHNVINELLDEVNFDEIKPKQITLKLRYEKHKITSKTKTLFDQSTINNVNIYSYALELFLDLWNENPIKGIAISLGKL